MSDFEKNKDPFSKGSYRIVALLLTYGGLWKNGYIEISLPRCVAVIWTLGGSIFRALGSDNEGFDKSEYIEVLVATVMLTVTVFQFILNIYKKSKINTILEICRQIRGFDDESQAIIQTHHEEGEKIVSIILASGFFGCIAFIIAPLVLEFPNLLGLSNATLSLLKAPTLVRREGPKYYYQALVYFDILTVLMATIFSATQMLFVFIIQRILGNLALLSYQLKNTKYMNQDVSLIAPNFHPNYKQLYIGFCIQSHRKVIEFINIVESTYHMLDAFRLCLYVPCVAMCLIVVEDMGFQFDCLRNLIFLFYVQAVTILTVYTPCQKVIDYSVLLGYDLYSGEWYNERVTVQKTILMVARRCSRPCGLSMGKIFIVGHETCLLISKTTFSYYMTLRSITLARTHQIND